MEVSQFFGSSPGATSVWNGLFRLKLQAPQSKLETVFSRPYPKGIDLGRIVSAKSVLLLSAIERRSVARQGNTFLLSFLALSPPRATRPSEIILNQFLISLIKPSSLMYSWPRVKRSELNFAYTRPARFTKSRRLGSIPTKLATVTLLFNYLFYFIIDIRSFGIYLSISSAQARRK